MSSLDAILGVATPDVADAVEWLLAAGANLTRADGPHGMAVATIEFAMDDAQVRMVRDRGQWTLDVRLAGQPWLQLDLIHAARLGDAYRWPSVRRSAHDLPEQLPVGLSWRRELPTAFAWLRATADAADQVENMGRVRAAKLFPRA